MEFKTLPALMPQREINRLLSFLEYYFASIGRSSFSQEGDCEIITIIEGESRVTRSEWEAALAKVVDANPACRLRIVGRRQNARWSSDGVGTRIRHIESCAWDGRSHIGAEFIKATHLDLENGPTSELIIAKGEPDRIMIRAHHAVMDGMGIVYFFQELFRALRGEPLLGTNAIFSDADLMQSVAAQRPPKLEGKPASLTGGVRRAQRGNVWRRISATGVKPNYLLGKLAVWIKQFAERYSNLPVRIMLPVNLRRHCDGLNSMLNFTGIVIVEVSSTDGADEFRRKLRDLLKINAEANYSPTIEKFRYLPMAWLDWVGAKFARHENTKDTVGVSNFGVVKPEHYRCENFSPRAMFALPAFDGNAFIVIAIMNNTAEISVGMPLGLASDGRFDALMNYLGEQLQQ
ncbi:MAG: hypothetical protein QM709_01990 [Spongiibacteraceae bacterium]